MDAIPFPTLHPAAVDPVWFCDGTLIDDDKLVKDEIALVNEINSFAVESAPAPIGINSQKARNGSHSARVGNEDRDTATDASDDGVDDYDDDDDDDVGGFSGDDDLASWD